MKLPFKPLRANPHPGFTLVELLLGITLASVVVAGAGAALVAHMRSSVSSERMVQLRDDWARISEFMENEIAESERVILDTTKIAAFKGNRTCSLTNAQIRFAGLAPHTQVPIIYGIRPPSNAEINQWPGPNVVVRCGPTIDANGRLDPSTYVESAMAGAATSLAANLITTDTNTATRAISVTLALTTPSGGAYSNSFRDRDRVNPPYNLLDDIALGQTTCNAGIRCYSGGGTLTGSATPGTNQYIPTGTVTIQGSPESEDVVYFQGNAADFTIPTNNCTRSSCVVSGATMRDVEVAVFYDREFRM